MLTPLNLPLADLKITRKKGVLFVWCIIRKKQLQLTPEEWVRQHLIHYLVYHKKIAIGRIASEVNLQLGELSRRCDVLVVNEVGEPLVLLECKAPGISIGSQVMHQIAHYNRAVGAEFLVLSNGLQHVIVHVQKEDGSLKFLDDLPTLN